MKLTEKLKKKDIVATPQRMAIAGYLEDNTNHPDAETIYENLKEKFPTMSVATVYSTVDLLKEHGMIQELHIRSGLSNYDPNTEQHCHFLCEHCDTVKDVFTEIEIPDGLENHRVESAKGYFYGVCSNCQNKKGE